MADKTEVSAKCEVKNIYDKSLASAVQTAMAKTIQTGINKSSSFKYVSKTNKGFMLTVTVQSLTKNDKNQLEAKIALSGVYIGGTAKAFNASSSGKGEGVDAADLVGDLLDDMMGKVIKTMDGLMP